MCIRCRDLGMRAWHAVGADNFPVMEPDKLAEFLEGEAQKAFALLTDDYQQRKTIGSLADKIAGMFGGDVAAFDLPPIPPMPQIESVRATIGALTAEFWTEHQFANVAAAWVAEHHPSGNFVGIPFELLPEPVRVRAIGLAVNAMYDREIARRIARDLPPLPDMGMFSPLTDDPDAPAADLH